MVYRIPVTFVVRGYQEVEADSETEARELVYDMEYPTETEIVPDTFEIDDDTGIDCQN